MSIPAIPAGAQLGGAGTAENHAAANFGGAAPVAPAIPNVAPVQAPIAPTAPATPNADVPPVPVRDPVSGQWVLPSAAAPVAQSPLAPAGAPQAPVPVPEKAPVPEAAIQKPVQPVQGETYLETSVNHFAAEVGIESDAIMESIEKALEHGDIGLINVANLGALTPEQAQRATQLAQMAYQHTQTEISNMQQAVYAAAGGEAQWNSAIAAFNASATDEAKGYVAYLADHAGNAKAAAEYVTKYVQGAGLTTQVQQAPIQGGTGAPVAQGLDKQSYSNGIHSLEMQLASRQITQGEYNTQLADLDYRRQLGRNAGL